MGKYNTLVQGIPGNQYIFISGDLNGHGGKDTHGLDEALYRAGNEEGKAILQFALALI